MKAIAKKGKDKLASSYQSVLEVPVTDINGKSYSQIGELLQGKRCILMVNVASK